MQRSVHAEIKKIAEASASGYKLEAFLRAYHVNISLMRALLIKADSKNITLQKPKAFFKFFFKEQKRNAKMKTLVNSQSTKLLKGWVERSDAFFKALRLGPPLNPGKMLDESHRITKVLNISLAKAVTRRGTAATRIR